MMEKMFDCEETCVKLLYRAKWPDGYICPRCGHGQCFTIQIRRLPLFECRSCGHQASLTAGTVMEGSRLPLRYWFLAIYHHAHSEAISASRLSQILQVTYKTAWLMGHKIRHAMSQSGGHQLLTGLVRITPAIYGRAYNSTACRHPQEHPLLIGAALNGHGEPHSIKIAQIEGDDINGRSPCYSGVWKFQQRHVSPRAIEVISDNRRPIHDRSKQLMQIGRRASKWLNDTFKGIGPKHLQPYLDQFCFLWNHEKNPLTTFNHSLTCCVTFPRITYKALTSRPDRKPAALDYYRVRKMKRKFAS
uniref:Transposase n=2 Tax=Cohnella candidum TaxID=2674991 RepID=A0A3G3JTT4_9BACL|nr:transposase [Cohnella candidum]